MTLILSGTDGLSDVDGSAATPAIRGTDANTGIFFPAADTIAFAEGGAEIARFDSSGNLGIGTSSLVSRLTVKASGGTYSTGALALVGSSSGTSYITNAGGTLYVSNDGSTDQLVLNSSGNLGLGGNSDMVGLAVQTPSYTTAYAADLAGNAATAGYGSQLQVVSPSESSTVSGISLFTRTTGRSRWDILNVWTSSYLGDLVFRRRNGGTSTAEAMRIDSSGNFQVGGTRSNVRLYAQASGQRVIEFSDNSNYSVGMGLSPSAGGNSVGWIGGTGGTAFALGANNLEHVRIGTNGDLLVGTTSVPSAGSGGSAFYVDSDGRRALAMSTTSTAGRTLVAFMNPNGTVGAINTSGSSTSYATSSDYRLKNSVAPMIGALAKVSALKPVTYKWNADGSDGEGFIAHELAEVVPHAVIGEKDATRIEQYEISPAVPATFDEEGNELTPAVEAVMGEREVPVYQGIDTSFLVATLTAAIQEQQTLIESLKARLDAANL